MIGGGEIIYIIKTDNQKFKSGLDTAEKNAIKSASRMSSAFAKIGALVAATGIVTLAKKTIELGIAAEETGSKFAVVFSDILPQANKEIENLTENFGLSTLAAQTLLSGTGDLLTGFGFTQDMALSLSAQTAQLGADLASFSNYAGGAKGATEALTKALLGEREGVKALGISIMEEDIVKQIQIDTANGVTFATEREAKAYATLQLAIGQSKNAIGDFVRTQDSVANRVRILQNRFEDLGVSIGGQLTPVVGTVVSQMIEQLPKFERFIQPIIPVFSKIGETFGGVIRLAGELMEALTPVMEIAGAIIGAVLDIGGSIINMTADAVQSYNDWNNTIEQGAEGILATYEETGEKVEYAGMAARTLADGLARARDNGEDLDAAVEQMAEQSGYSVEQIEKYAASMGIVTKRHQEVIDLQKKELSQKILQNHIMQTYIIPGQQMHAAQLQAATEKAEAMTSQLVGADKTYAEFIKKMDQEEARRKGLLALGIEQENKETELLFLKERIKEIEEGIAAVLKDGGSVAAAGVVAKAEELRLLKEKLPLLEEELALTKEKGEEDEDQAKKKEAQLKKEKELWDALGDTLEGKVKTAYADVFNLIGEGLAGGEVSFGSFAELALKALGDILDALGSQLLALAAVNFANIPVAVALAAGSAAAFIAAGAIKANASNWAGTSAANGADFIVPPGYPNDSYPVMVESGERVQVTPNTQTSGGRGELQGQIVLVVDGEQMRAHIQKQIDNGKLRLAGARA